MFRELLVSIMLSQVRFQSKNKTRQIDKEMLVIVLRMERKISVIFFTGSLLHDGIKR